jgi:hypothetical protein
MRPVKVKIERPCWDAAYSSVVFDATYLDCTYYCRVPSQNLNSEIGHEAVAEFNKRLPEIKKLLERELWLVHAQMLGSKSKAPDIIIKI